MLIVVLVVLYICPCYVRIYRRCMSVDYRGIVELMRRVDGDILVLNANLEIFSGGRSVESVFAGIEAVLETVLLYQQKYS